MRSADTDAEVRERAEDCISDLWTYATDMVRTQDGTEWEALFRTTGRVEGAIRAVTKVAKEVSMDDEWLNRSLEWALSVLRKVGKMGKNDAFACLDALLRAYVSLFLPDIATTDPHNLMNEDISTVLQTISSPSLSNK